MSSAANHMIRSHRSQTYKRSACGKIQTSATYRENRISFIKSMRLRISKASSKSREPKSDKA